MVIEKVDRVRARNFQFLFEQFKEDRRRKWPDEPDRGMLTRFAEHLELNKVYLSNINSGNKVIGVKTARHIEKMMNVPEGWLDTDHSRDAALMSDDDVAFQDSVMAIYRQAPEASRAVLLRAFQALVTGKPIDEALADHSNGTKKHPK
jgi:plasmid maintenance system antidote protein VapI